MKYLVLIISLLFFKNSFAQKVIVKDIIVIGNKKTKTKILTRELTFSIGDSLNLKNISSLFEKNSRYLIGTYLVSKCIFSFTKLKQEITIEMKVKDAWYIFPIPIFELADRNFNVWWNEYNHNLSRTNLGLQIKHYNFSGRRDKLKLTAQHGYTQKLELDYKIPGINHNKTLGFFFNLYFKRSKETPYSTVENKLIFLKEEAYNNNSFRAFLGISYRPKHRSSHSSRLLFRKNSISDLIKDNYNPDYFSTLKSNQKYFEFRYRYIYDSRDFQPYPTQGFLIASKVSKYGLGIFNDINYLNLENSIRWYQPILKNLYFASFSKTNLRWSKDKIAYNQIQALGYRENQLHGYAYYVIDGEHFGFVKTSFRYRLINNKINWKSWMPIQSFKIMPIEVFGTFNNDIGYVYTQDYKKLGNYDNKMIWGGGLGIDIIFYTTFVIRIDYSINQFQEKGIFLHFNPIF